MNLLGEVLTVTADSSESYSTAPQNERMDSHGPSSKLRWTVRAKNVVS
jgi:hypothetical protein